MKEILKPAVKLWGNTSTSNNNHILIKNRGKTTIGFGIGFWITYLLFKSLDNQS